MSNQLPFERLMDDVMPICIPIDYIYSVSICYQNGSRSRLTHNDFSHIAAHTDIFSSEAIAELEEKSEVIDIIDITIDHAKLERDITQKVTKLMDKFFPTDD
jgi:hypothetical protein